MPLYEYECGACGHRFEIIQRFSDPPATICPACGKGPLNKLLSAPAFHFKGTGWYVTDYARKGESAATAPSGPEASGSTSSAGESPASTDSKPAASESSSTAKPESK